MLSACKKQEHETRTIQLDAFKYIEFNSPFTVNLAEDTVFYIELVGRSKKIDKIDVKVEDSMLRLENTSNSNWLTPKEKVILTIHSKPLREIVANETCQIKTVNPITSHEVGIIMKSKANEAELELNCNIFYYWNNFPCGGKLTLSGTTQQLKIWNTAIMSVDAQQLTTSYALVENDSKGDCTVTASDIIEYAITGSGNIHVYGGPSNVVNNGVTSSGEVIFH